MGAGQFRRPSNRAQRPHGPARRQPSWSGHALIALRRPIRRPAELRPLHLPRRRLSALLTRSEDFRRRWSAHNVRYHGAGTKRFHHQVVGDLDLAYESVDMISDPGLTLTLYAAEPASPTAHALDLLAAWTATESEHATTG